MSDHIEQVIADILDRWPPTHAWTDERKTKWCLDLADNLGGEKPEVLKWALKLLVANRNFGSTPLVAEVLKSVNQAVKEIGAQRRAGMLKLDDGQTYDADDPTKWDKAWTSDGVKLAYQLIQTEMGRRAAKEGWIRPLWCFICVERRLPTEHEIETPWLDPTFMRNGMEQKRAGLKAAARRHDEEMDRLARNTSAIGKKLYAMAQDIVTDGRRLADIANGKTHAPKSDYFLPIGVPANDLAKLKDNPPSKYADENLAEGRGWKGMTA